MKEIPKPGYTVNVSDAIKICYEHGRAELARRLEDNQYILPKYWVFNGCSKFFQEYKDLPIYKCCFWHDCAYLVGGSEVQRLEADFTLGLDILRMTGSEWLAFAMFTSVRVGGDRAWRKDFSWGYGRPEDPQKMIRKGAELRTEVEVQAREK